MPFGQYVTLHVQGKLKIRQDVKTGMKLPCIDERGTLFFDGVIALIPDQFADKNNPARGPYFELWQEGEYLGLLRKPFPGEELEIASQKIRALTHQGSYKKFQTTKPALFITYHVSSFPRWQGEQEFLEEHRTHWHHNPQKPKLSPFYVKQTGYGSDKNATKLLCWESHSVLISGSGSVIWGI